MTELAGHDEESEAESEPESAGPATPAGSVPGSPKLFRLSDATGDILFTTVTPQSPAGYPGLSDFDQSDAFLLDDSANAEVPAVYTWLGEGASLTEKRLAMQYAQAYLWKMTGGGKKRSSTSLVRLTQVRNCLIARATVCSNLILGTRELPLPQSTWCPSNPCLIYCRVKMYN